MAEACVFLLKNYSDAGHINVVCGEDISIMDAARLVARVVGYSGRIETDPEKSDGTPPKLLDCSRIFGMGWRARIGLEAGLRQTCEDFLRNAG